MRATTDSTRAISSRDRIDRHRPPGAAPEVRPHGRGRHAADAGRAPLPEPELGAQRREGRGGVGQDLLVDGPVRPGAAGEARRGVALAGGPPGGDARQGVAVAVAQHGLAVLHRGQQVAEADAREAPVPVGRQQARHHGAGVAPDVEHGHAEAAVEAVEVERQAHVLDHDAGREGLPQRRAAVQDEVAGVPPRAGVGQEVPQRVVVGERPRHGGLQAVVGQPAPGQHGAPARVQRRQGLEHRLGGQGLGQAFLDPGGAAAPETADQHHGAGGVEAGQRPVDRAGAVDGEPHAERAGARAVEVARDQPARSTPHRHRHAAIHRRRHAGLAPPSPRAGNGRRPDGCSRRCGAPGPDRCGGTARRAHTGGRGGRRRGHRGGIAADRGARRPA